MHTLALIEPRLQTFTLADSRRLTWQEFGVPEGRPVFYFHGGGSFSLEAGIFHREAVRENVRLIATNRPGAAGSSVCPGRSVAAYSDDVVELLDHLRIDRFGCVGESNGGLVAMAVACKLAARVVGAVPINPTVPWFDPVARRVSPCSVGIAYRLIRYWPGLVIALAGSSARRQKSDLVGPPPGTEPDVAAFHWRVIDQAGKHALAPELKWASSHWGFDHYAIPVKLDFFCGVHDAQAPFALVLADRNPDARFHYFPYGHYGFSHPDARRRIFKRIAGYF